MGSEKHILSRIFFYLMTAKNFQMTVPFTYNFRSLSYKFLTIFLLKFNFHIFLPNLGYFSQKKGTENFRIKKCGGVKSENVSHSQYLKFHLKIFEKNNTQTLVISNKRFKFLQDDRTDTNFIAPLRMHFQVSKSTLDSLKSVFNVFRRTPSLGASDNIKKEWHFEYRGN